VSNDLFDGWTFVQLEPTPTREGGFYVRSPEGIERRYTVQTGVETAINMIVDTAAGRQVGDFGVALWQRVVGPQVWDECLTIAKVVGEAYADEIEKIAAMVAVS